MKGIDHGNNSDENDGDDNGEDMFSSNEKASGYCHFNDNERNTNFEIELFGHKLLLVQNPASSLGHGAVVWDASVIFSKFIENNPKLYSPSNLAGKTVIELGSGVGLGGICFMLKGADVTFTDLETIIESITTTNVQVLIFK
jgi:predicted nicotinamide N-methyase